jgi:DNA repair and recombination protein RAD54B
MASDIPAEIASVLQSASIKRHPSPRHDLNPSTAASEKRPVHLDSHPDLDSLSDVAEDEIPISVLQPIPRKQNMPPLPDLRFEQSYLKSIEQAEGWQGVAWITVRDQVCIQGKLPRVLGLTEQVIMCFAQGVMWNLILHGWRHWNREAKFSGRGVGARIRRWWWGVNKWTIPSEKRSRLSDTKLARNVSEVSAVFMRVGSALVPFKTAC